MSMPLTQKQLDEYLFKATDIIRGKLDGSEFKDFIFGLFFLKRCSDVFEERKQATITEKVEEGHSQVQAEELAEQKTNYTNIVYVPISARWSFLLK